VIDYELIVVGASWGGLSAVSSLLRGLPDDLGPAIAIAQHRSADSQDGGLASLLQLASAMPVADAEDKQPVERGHVYIAPPDYHLLIEPSRYFSLSTDERVSFARPSIDVLFESAADAYGAQAIGIILTGANDDGARGLARIKDAGGVALVQSPGEAERRTMPDAALAATVADAILPLEDIGPFLRGLCSLPTMVRGST